MCPCYIRGFCISVLFICVLYLKGTFLKVLEANSRFQKMKSTGNSAELFRARPD